MDLRRGVLQQSSVKVTSGVKGLESKTSLSEEDELFHLIALTKVEKAGPVTCRGLVEHFGSAKAVFQAGYKELSQISGLKKSFVQALSAKTGWALAEREMEFMQKNDVQALVFNMASYPRLLREIYDHPALVYQKGAIRLNEIPSVSIVGTRKPSSYGLGITRYFAETLAAKGFNVVSGLAYGVDAYAHEAALNMGGITTGVLGHGLKTIYPRQHASIADRLISQGGALLTEFCSDTSPDAYNFPSRNRIISGLSHATIVIEAQEKGGALITAKMAFEQDRLVYAIPGNIGLVTSRGCNQLIRDNIAKLVLDPAEVIEDLAAMITMHKEDKVVMPSATVPWMNDEEKAIVEAIVDGCEKLEEIATRTHLSSSTLLRSLLAMEIRGCIENRSGRYMRVMG